MNASASEADRPLLLIVEDDATLRDRLARAMRSRGYLVREAATTTDALALAQDDPPEFVLLDLRVGEGSTLSLVPEFRRLDPATRVVVLTGYGSIATALEAVRLGATHYLTKPADADEIVAAFAHGIEAPKTEGLPASTMSLARVEWEHINRVLVACDGNVSEAARTLGLHRRSLQRKLLKYPPTH